MKTISLLFFILLSAFKLIAHPGIGLVYDGNNSIFYTDLDHVWRLDLESGKSEIYLENIHTHELFLDKTGNLYGEHYWYIESEEAFKNYIWKAEPNGKIQIIREEQYGENEDFSFIRNDVFSSFKIRKVENAFEIVRRDSLTDTILFKGELKNPTWGYLNGESFLFIDHPSVYSYDSGNVVRIAEDVSSKRFPFSTQSDEHNIYGIWTDKNDNIYVAIYGGREVKKIDRKGNINRVLKTNFLWSPVNGVFDKKGNLWLMECKIGGEIRVRKVSELSLNENATFIYENLIFYLLILCLIFIVSKNILRKKKRKNYAQQRV